MLGLTRVFLELLIIATLLLLFFELNRWRDSLYREALSRSQRKRRIAGAVLLLIVLGMVFGGTYFPAHPRASLVASEELLYWLFCLLLTVFLPLLAYLEAKASLQRYVEERKKARMEATDGMEGLIQKALLNTDQAPKNGHKETKSQKTEKPPKQ
ncbi:MAG TPA: hypothetical protein VFW40_06110 [Capsulimonadaceae bacterium]|nr:hypothetical protein [Capsulimonadaceae bacterium]